MAPLIVVIGLIVLLRHGPGILETLVYATIAGCALVIALISTVLIRLALTARRMVRRWSRFWTPPAQRPVDWTASHRRFDALRAEYAGYECNPLAVLRLPALADVTVPSTARFVAAFATAQALHTEVPPPAAMASEYQAAVDTAVRAWQAATQAAERIRLAGLSPEERTSVQRVIKILTMAERTGHEAERHAAYTKALEELARLERTGRLQLPTPAMTTLYEASRTSLTATAVSHRSNVSEVVGG